MKLPHDETQLRSEVRNRFIIGIVAAALAVVALSIAMVAFSSNHDTALAAQELTSASRPSNSAPAVEPVRLSTTASPTSRSTGTQPVQTYFPSLTGFQPFQPPDGWAVVGEYRLNQVAPDSPAEYNQTIELSNARGGRVAVSVIRDEMSTGDPSQMFGPNFEKRVLADGREAWTAGDPTYGTAVMVVIVDANTTMLFNGLSNTVVEDLVDLAGRVSPGDELTTCSRQSDAPECDPGFISVGEVTR